MLFKVQYMYQNQVNCHQMTSKLINQVYSTLQILQTENICVIKNRIYYLCTQKTAEFWICVSDFHWKLIFAREIHAVSWGKGGGVCKSFESYTCHCFVILWNHSEFGVWWFPICLDQWTSIWFNHLTSAFKTSKCTKIDHNVMPLC